MHREGSAERCTCARCLEKRARRKEEKLASMRRNKANFGHLPGWAPKAPPPPAEDARAATALAVAEASRRGVAEREIAANAEAGAPPRAEAEAEAEARSATAALDRDSGAASETKVAHAEAGIREVIARVVETEAAAESAEGPRTEADDRKRRRVAEEAEEHEEVDESPPVVVIAPPTQSQSVVYTQGASQIAPSQFCAPPTQSQTQSGRVMESPWDVALRERLQAARPTDDQDPYAALLVARLAAIADEPTMFLDDNGAPVASSFDRLCAHRP